MCKVEISVFRIKKKGNKEQEGGARMKTQIPAVRILTFLL